jgi:hypothetical protein
MTNHFANSRNREQSLLAVSMTFIQIFVTQNTLIECW